MSFFSLFIPLIILVAYLFTMLVTVGNTVTEKSTKMKVSWFLLRTLCLLASVNLFSKYWKGILEANRSQMGSHLVGFVDSLAHTLHIFVHFNNDHYQSWNGAIDQKLSFYTKKNFHQHRFSSHFIFITYLFDTSIYICVAGGTIFQEKYI